MIPLLLARRLAAAVALTVAFSVLPHFAMAEVKLQLPSGIDFLRLKKIEKTESPKTKVYIQMIGIGDKTDAKLLIGTRAGTSVGTSDQITRKFADKIAATNRFEVFTEKTTGVRDKSDIVVEGMVVTAIQDLEDFSAIRKSVTTLRLSINILDTQSGKVVLAKTVTGIYGDAPGEGTPLVKEADARKPENQERLMNDFERALQEALESAAALIERRYRPIGKVLQVEGNDLAIFGGAEHGFRADDKLIVFRGNFIEQNGRKLPGLMKVVAAVTCPSVSDENAQCSILRKAPELSPQAGDYVLLSDDNLKLGTQQ